MPITVNDIVGTWNMVHDDWPGNLTINPPDQQLIAVDGPCHYISWRIDGHYVQQNSVQQLHMDGYFQGKDLARQTNEPCKWSESLITFNIAFAGALPQPFTGYIFTHRRNRMAGYTWWGGLPFGWCADKTTP